MIETILSQARKHDVIFHRNRWRIDILSRVSKDINLELGDVIDIAVKNGEYFLFVKYKAANKVGTYEATVWSPYKNTKKNNHFRATSARMCRAMFSVVKNSDGIDALRLAAGEPMEIEGLGKAVPLITRRAM